MTNVRVTQVRIGLDEAIRLLQEALDSLAPFQERGYENYNPNPALARSRIERVMDGLEASAELLDESGLVIHQPEVRVEVPRGLDD
jgi:hypothetical protein